MRPKSSHPLDPVILNEELFAPKGSWKQGPQRTPFWLPTLENLQNFSAWSRKSASPKNVPRASPSFAGDEANVIRLTVRVDPPCLPPLLIASINYMQHIPKAEAQGLAQEAAVLGLVVIKQGPRGQVAMGQDMAKTPGSTYQPLQEPA